MVDEMTVKAREILHNLKDHDFDSCGNYKMDCKEAEKTIQVIETYVSMMTGGNERIPYEQI